MVLLGADKKNTDTHKHIFLLNSLLEEFQNLKLMQYVPYFFLLSLIHSFIQSTTHNIQVTFLINTDYCITVFQTYRNVKKYYSAVPDTYDSLTVHLPSWHTANIQKCLQI